MIKKLTWEYLLLVFIIEVHTYEIKRHVSDYNKSVSIITDPRRVDPILFLADADMF